MPTKQEELISALGAHDLYDPKTRRCENGNDWCLDYYLKAMMPASDDGPAMPTTVMLAPVTGIAVSSIFLWPAYLGARLWIGIWVAIPWLFGYRFKVTVVNGQARSRLIRKSRAH